MSKSSLSPERLARLELLADRQDILDCLTRVSRGVDRFDRDLFLSCFHHDALLDAGGYVNSPETVYDGAALQHKTDQVSTLHNILNHSCEIDGDVAHTETYLLFTGVNRDHSNWMAGGRYLDRFERRAGEWKIAFRYTLIEWSGVVPSASNPLFDNIADRHMNGSPSRGKEDPSYRRPLVNLRPRRTVEDPAALGPPKL